MQGVTLQQMLEARERRVALQTRLLRQYRTPLVCFTMNIAGPIKVSPLIERAFYEGVRALESTLTEQRILHREVEVSVTGCQAVFCVDVDAETLKAICIAIEDGRPLGRLFDMDVLDTDGTKTERGTVRGCIVCGAPGRGCAARRRHTVAELQRVTREIITDHFFLADSGRIAESATDSLLAEVFTTPKPGLVDRRNNGSHTDMTVETFEKSARALTPYFRRCVGIGRETAGQSPSDTFRLLREAGLAAEGTMYRVTGGVNTHKGAIYSMGVLCGAAGRLWAPETPVPELRRILSVCSDMTRDAVQQDLSSIGNTTAGGRLYREQGLTGIRGEVAAGFPSVKNIGLPVYRKALDSGLSANDAGAVTLLHLIAGVQDTNLYHRGGREGARFAADGAKRLLEASAFPSKEQIEQLDDAFIARRLSPGGCADLLAVTYFLAGWSNETR